MWLSVFVTINAVSVLALYVYFFSLNSVYLKAFVHLERSV